MEKGTVHDGRPKMEIVFDKGLVILAPYTYFYSLFALLAVSESKLLNKDYLPYKDLNVICHNKKAYRGH
jgi:hypothetical protein